MSYLVRIILLISFICLISVPAEAKKAKAVKKRAAVKKSVVKKSAVKKPYIVHSRSAYLWNATTNKVYYSKNPDLKVYPASTTKVMTVLLALEHLPLNKLITVKRSATLVEPSKLNLVPGEKYFVSELIYACLLKSANDASAVLAEAVAGTQWEFVAMMNRKAKTLGARSTKFANPHGLPSKQEQYTTAADMALIFRAALKNSFFTQVISEPRRTIRSEAGRKHFLKSHNKAFFFKWKKGIYGKTGYTRKAQHCFVGYFKRGKEIVIVDVFGGRKRWDDIKWMVEKKAGIDL